MKKVVAMIALAAICFGTSAYAFTPVKTMQQDTTKVKIKKKNGKTKIKKKMKDTTAVK
jgi:hypothetical protein